MTEELKEQTSDWIMQAYIQDDETYGCQHGVYHLAKPQQIVCSLCGKVMMDEQELDEWHSWTKFLCRGA